MLLEPVVADRSQPMWTAVLSLRDMERDLRAEPALLAPGGRALSDLSDEEPILTVGRSEADADADISAPAPTAELVLDKSLRRLLTRVNRAANRQIRPRSDIATSGRAEYWSYPVTIDGARYGDCEDYALEKKRLLVEAGVPSALLTLAVAHTAQGLVHAVLVVSTDKGDLVLDNRSDKVSPWTKARYRWVMRQVSGDTREWAHIAPQGSLKRS